MRDDVLVPEVSAAIPQRVNAAALDHLVRADGDEDLLFALWTPSQGSRRTTAMVHTLLFPQEGDRQRHGNVSFNPQYFERVAAEALSAGCGIAFLHSHPGPGWQGMSRDDVAAELRMAGVAAGLTDLPLLGMTVGTTALGARASGSTPRARRMSGTGAAAYAWSVRS